MAKRIKEDDILIKVQNTTIKIGDSYEVVGKMDLDAPDEAFKKHNTTKYLIKGIGDSRSIPFDDKRNLWDTGFDVRDTSNRDMKEEDKAYVSAYNKHIKEPYEEKYNVKLDALDRKDSPWYDLIIDIQKGRIFDTTDEKDRLQLFLALQHYFVCEKDDKSYKTRNANYNIINKAKSIDVKKDRYGKKLEAITVFNNLLNSDTDTLYLILEWIGYGTVRNTPKESLMLQVMESFEQEEGYTSVQNFLDVYKMSQDKTRKEELDLFSYLNQLRYTNRLKYERREFLLDGEVIGNSLKDAAKRALANPELKSKIINIAADVFK